MKKTLETNEEKIQKICDVLRNETLEPAKKEADQIIASAKEQAAQITLDAEAHAVKLIKEAQHLIEQKQNVFRSSLEQAVKQSLEALRQAFEREFFSQQLYSTISEQTANPQIIANLISALTKAIEKDGTAVDLSVFIPTHVSIEEVNRLLGQQMLAKIKNHSVALGGFTGGVQVRLDKERVTLEITDKELADLIARYARKDFRKLIFAAMKVED